MEPVQPSRHDSLIQDETGRFQKQKKKENCLVPKPVLGSVTTNFRPEQCKAFVLNNSLLGLGFLMSFKDVKLLGI